MRLRLRIRCGDAPSVPKRISPVNWARDKMKALRQCQAEHRHQAQAHSSPLPLYQVKETAGWTTLCDTKSTVRASVQRWGAAREDEARRKDSCPRPSNP